MVTWTQLGIWFKKHPKALKKKMSLDSHLWRGLHKWAKKKPPPCCFHSAPTPTRGIPVGVIRLIGPQLRDICRSWNCSSTKHQMTEAPLCSWRSSSNKFLL